MIPPQISQQGVNVIISWVAPNSGSLAISAYKVEILTADGVTFKQTKECDGTNSMIIANLFCSVPMQTLTQYPYNLQVQQPIRVRISASNSLGFSIISALNTVSFTAQTVPLKPASVPVRYYGTSPS